VVVLGCWTAAPGDGDRNDYSNRSAYGNGSCSSLLAELLVAARVAKREMGSRRPGKARLLEIPAGAPGAAAEWTGSPLLWVTREHYEIVKNVQQEEEERRSSAAILVDVSRSELILNGRKGPYAGREESGLECSVGWKEGQWGMGGRGSFPDGW